MQKVVVDRLFQLGDAGEGATPDALSCDLREEALDEIKPRGGGRREVQLEARMLGEPGLHLVRLVRRGVVEHNVHVEVLANDPIDPPHECDELAGAMAWLAVADNEAALHVHRRIERGDAMTLVVVRQRCGPALLQRQARLRAVERLDLALLIDTENERAIRRVHVEPDDVSDFLLELRVVGDLELGDEVRLETGLSPDPLHARVADAHRLGHRAHAPVRGGGRRLAHGLRQDLGLQRGRQRLAARRPGFVALEAIDAFGGIALLPTPHAWLRLTRRSSNRLDALAVSRGQHDPSPPNHFRRRVAIRHQAHEPHPIFSRDRDICFHATSLHDLPGHGNPASVTEH